MIINTNKQKKDPRKKFKQAPFPKQKQEIPGHFSKMDPLPDHGEQSYVGTGKLEGKKVIITGGDSGIGRAVAIAYAREGADVLISYLNEDNDAKDTAAYIEQEGKKAVLVKGDISKEKHCKKIIEKAISTMETIDILINNAAFQQSRPSLQDIDSKEWEHTFEVNVHAMFYLCKAAEPHMKPGSCIINTTSVNAYSPVKSLLAYATTKGAIQNYTSNLAQLLAEKGIRVNCVAPGPIWTPLIPATLEEEKVENFGKNTPLGRVGMPAELAPVYVLLASDEASYITGATIPVTGGMTTI